MAADGVACPCCNPAGEWLEGDCGESRASSSSASTSGRNMAISCSRDSAQQTALTGEHREERAHRDSGGEEGCRAEAERREKRPFPQPPTTAQQHLNPCVNYIQTNRLHSVNRGRVCLDLVGNVSNLSLSSPPLISAISAALVPRRHLRSCLFLRRTWSPLELDSRRCSLASSATLSFSLSAPHTAPLHQPWQTCSNRRQCRQQPEIRECNHNVAHVSRRVCCKPPLRL